MLLGWGGNEDKVEQWRRIVVMTVTVDLINGLGSMSRYDRPGKIILIHCIPSLKYSKHSMFALTTQSHMLREPSSRFYHPINLI